MRLLLLFQVNLQTPLNLVTVDWSCNKRVLGMPRRQDCVSIKYPNWLEILQANTPAAHALAGRCSQTCLVLSVRRLVPFTAYADGPREQTDSPRLRYTALTKPCIAYQQWLPMNSQLHWEPVLNLTYPICSQLHNADIDQAPRARSVLVRRVCLRTIWNALLLLPLNF